MAHSIGNLCLAAVILMVAFSTVAQADTAITLKFHVDSYEQGTIKIPDINTGSTVTLGTAKLRIDYVVPFEQVLLYHADSNAWFTLNPKFEAYSKGKPFEALAMNFSKSLSDTIGFADGLKALDSLMDKAVYRISATDDVKEINGFHCNRTKLEQFDGADTTTVEIWATEDVKLDYALFNESAYPSQLTDPKAARFAAELRKVKGLHVMTVTMMSRFGSKSTAEIVEIKNFQAPEGFFDIPRNYELLGAESDNQ